MKNYFLIALAAFIIWAAATGRLMNWFALAKAGISPAPVAG